MERSPAGQGPSKSSNSEFLPFKANIPLYVQTTSRLALILGWTLGLLPPFGCVN